MTRRKVSAPVRVCLGGTFDRLHVGHEVLLARAFELGDEVFIGVTSQRLAERHRARPVRPFAVRRRGLQALLRRKGWRGVVDEIDDPFGRSVEARYDAIVVSRETLPRTKAINRERQRLGLRPLRVFVVPFVYSEDGLRLSATRMIAGRIDGRGHRRTPLRVAVGTKNALKVSAVRDAFRRAFPRLRVRVRAVPVRTGVPAQPRDAQTLRGARARAERALRAWPGADYGVGIEAGLVRDRPLGRTVDVQYAAVVDSQGAWSTAHGGGFYYPRPILADVERGRTISQAVGPMAGDRRIGSTVGAVGFLSRGALTRRELTQQAVLLALVPRIRRDLYQE